VWRIFKTAHVKVAEFRKGRTRQADEQFVADCGLPAEAEAARVALAVRRAVASVGLIDPQFIRADDVYPDQLGVLPLWDSMDWAAFTMELERELGTAISDRGTGEIFIASRVSVKEMVEGVYRLMVARRGTLP
jgi:hypothetical protein